MYLIHIILLQFSISGYIYLVTFNKWLFRFVFIPIFFILSLFSYWVYTQDISVTNALIQIVLETKSTIAIDLISIPFVIFIMITLSLIILINRFYNKLFPFKFNIPFLIITIISIYSFTLVESKRVNTLKSRLPYSVFFGLKDYLKKEKYTFNDIKDGARSNIDSLKIVLVLGETVRADHLQLNGYNRETTPFLSKRKNIVSFNNIYTPHTYTASSLPTMITSASVYDKSLDSITSVFDVFNKCNYQTVWFGNQELERSYASIVKTNKKVVLVDSLRSYLSFKKAFDEELLKPFRSSFSNGKNKSLFTLHMMGSHWWYENRYKDAQRKFKPVIDSKHIPSLSKEQMINSYDNTIVYLDYFLEKLIKTIEQQDYPTVLIYISDHGEALGEDGKWLHGQNKRACMNPAMVLWFSNRFIKNYPLKVEAIRKNKYSHFTTDILYHSLLDLLEVKKVDYQLKESVFQNPLNKSIDTIY
ncbi:phosphoethanolamine transferase [Flavivirga aquimarina]|uniref:Phosphoethanolamine transferase n=1 Tax=Flavivirga aquimarina TaxID=2027862 RepID=A0ABT8W7S4_9FLAO|nr:phosphoethanolamine transferase [Flavivirga aquimarina]MDO5969175.1 phosphoethanolamine transferase [Flavivirga aquimarina]